MQDEYSPAQPQPEGWFPYTKLQPPQPGGSHVTRERLQQALRRAVRAHKLTLIAAPAGSGKTVLSASLAQGDLPLAWVALDETDDDLALFAALLAVALRPSLVDGGRGLLALLQAVPDLREKTAPLAARLINSLQPAGHHPVVLVLDDYHTIGDAAIHRFVTNLLDYLPAGLRLVIATRHDPPLPLPRLRARGELAEIRLPQLRFHDEEAAVFLNERRHLELPAAAVARLQAQTGGWAAGLQLLAAVLALLEDPGERARYVQRLAPDNRAIFDLLAAEVLAHQPPEIQTFLQQTAILPQLTPASCRTVTGDPGAGRLLADVYRRNLFLEAVTQDAANGPFRYHDLFRAFLQQRLRDEQPALWSELHRRAAGAASSDEQKLHHLTRAELWEEAAAHLEEMARLDSGRRFTRSSVVTAIEALPEAVRLKRPWLLLFVAQYYAVRGQLAAAAPWRAQAAARFREEGDELGEIELLVIGSMVDADDDGRVVDAFRQKTVTAGHLMRPDHWAIYHGGEQWQAIARHDWPAVTAHTGANITQALQSGNPGVMSLTGLSLGPQMAFCEGGMALLERFASHALQSSGPEELILRLCAQGLLGAVRFFQGRLAGAGTASREAHRLIEEVGGLAWIDHHVCWSVLVQLQARRAYREFDAFLAAQGPRWATQDTGIFYREGVLYMQGHSLGLRGHTASAQATLEAMQAGGQPAAYVLEDRLRRRLLAGQIAMARGETRTARRELREAVVLHEKVRHTIMLSHPRLALAALEGQEQRWRAALDELQRVVQELNARQTPGVILQEGERIVPVLRRAIRQNVERDFLAPLLQILEPEAGSSAMPLPNSAGYLTAREGEVLRLLATGATNPAIAARLSVTERTVKAHVTRILAKLEATTRTEAVTKARQLGLL